MSFTYFVGYNNGAAGHWAMAQGSSTSFLTSGSRGLTNPEKREPVEYSCYSRNGFYADDLCIFLAQYLARALDRSWVQINRLWHDRNEYKFFKVNNDEYSSFGRDQDKMIVWADHEISEAEFIKDVQSTGSWKTLSQCMGGVANLTERVPREPITIDVYVDMNTGSFMHFHDVLKPSDEIKATLKQIAIPPNTELKSVSEFIMNHFFKC